MEVEDVDKAIGRDSEVAGEVIGGLGWGGKPGGGEDGKISKVNVRIAVEVCGEDIIEYVRRAGG